MWRWMFCLMLLGGQVTADPPEATDGFPPRAGGEQSQLEVAPTIEAVDHVATAEASFDETEPAAELLRRLDAILDSPSAKATGAARRSLLLKRGRLLLEQFDDPQRALSDCRQVLAEDPQNHAALQLQSECIDLIGPIGIDESDPLHDPWVETWEVPPSVQELSMQPDWRTRCLVAVLFWISWTGVLFVSGSRTTRESRGSWWRLLAVAAALSSLWLVPVLVLAVFWPVGDQFPIGTLLFLFVNLLTLTALAFLQPPVYLRGTKERLKLVEDVEFLGRIARLAERVGCPAPPVRLLPSVSGSQQALAFAGTLQAPQLVVTDGILQRLDPKESDAVVAHELGHLANHSLWWYSLPGPLSAAVTCAGGATHMALAPALALWTVLFMGLKRCVSRPLEHDCDLRGARAVGFPAMAGALEKIHALHPIDTRGWLSLLTYATATHPSLELRLAVLYEAAPEEERRQMKPPSPLARRHRLAARCAAVGWVGSLAFGAVLNWWGVDSNLLLAIWLLTGLAPLILVILSSRRTLQRQRRKLGTTPRRGIWVVAAVTLGLVVAAGSVDAWAPGLRGLSETAILAIIGCVLLALSGLLFAVFRWSDHQKKKHAIAVALQLHEFEKALTLCDKAPLSVRRDRMVWYQRAICLAILGDQPAAVAELEALKALHPRFPLPLLTLAALYLNLDQSAMALEITRTLETLLPGDPLVDYLQVRALEELDRSADAREVLDRALRVNPREGLLLVMVAALDTDDGRYESAEEGLARAAERDPGSVELRLECARLAIARGTIEAAQEAVEQAARSLAANRLVFLDRRLQRVRNLLTERVHREIGGASPALPIVPPAESG